MITIVFLSFSLLDFGCHANKYLLTDLLKDELGFKGFVVSDWAAIENIPGDYKSDIIIDKLVDSIISIKDMK